MPGQPALSDAHVDAALTNIAIAYAQSQENFIADKVFPVVPVMKQSDKYFTFTKEDWRRDSAQRLGDGQLAAEDGFDMSSTAYSCDVWALAQFVGDQLRANFDLDSDPEEAAAQALMQKLLIRRERAFMTAAFADSIWGTTVDGDNAEFTQWDDDASSDPRSDVNTGISTVLTATGQMPNTLVVGLNVHHALIEHALIRDQFKYTSADSIDEAMLARYFGVKRYLVARSSYTSSAEGASSETNALVGGDHALLLHVPESPGLMVPSAGYTFAWNGYLGSGQGITTFRWRDDQRHATKVQVEMALDHKVTGSDLGYMLLNAIS